MTGITGWLRSFGLSRQHRVTVFATIQFFLVHLGVTTFTLGMHGLPQGRSGAVGGIAMALVAGPWLRLYVRAMMTVGTGRRIFLGMRIMIIRQGTHFRMMTLHTGFPRQLFLVIGRKLGVKFRGMTRTARERGHVGNFSFVMTVDAPLPHAFHILHVPGVGKNDIATLVVQPQTNGKLFRWGRGELPANGQSRQETADNGDWYVTFFQGCVLVLRLTGLKSKYFQATNKTP